MSLQRHSANASSEKSCPLIVIRPRVALIAAWLLTVHVSFPSWTAAQPSGQINPRELLVDVSDSDLSEFAADAAWDPQNPTLLRVLRRLRQIDYEPLMLLSEGALDPDSGQPGTLFDVRGELTKLIPVSVVGERSEEEWTYYIADIRLDSGRLCRVATIEIPDLWKTVELPSDTQTGCQGYMLKSIDESGTMTALLAARRLAWYPQSPMQGISDQFARLGRAGIDVGMFDYVRSREGQPLDRREMISLLPIVARAGDLLRETPEPRQVDTIELLRDFRGDEGDSFRLQVPSNESLQSTSATIPSPAVWDWIAIISWIFFSRSAIGGSRWSTNQILRRCSSITIIPRPWWSPSFRRRCKNRIPRERLWSCPLFFIGCGATNRS
jgi:hypothetical protein